MQYKYLLPVFTRPVFMEDTPKVTEGTVTLAERPHVGEEVEVNGVWHKISSIRHTASGLVLVFEDYTEA
ncbi:MAG: hypothetical protein UU77_C0019G0001 [candidate division WWE3 bacterium GW2011_GWC1_41_7]|nr:MAG: hypothetical protein UU72_C0013G0013 [candidate division WWE3 bacterium GW2011_GWB1_41_6]KKS20693.1 MAG: hypothetical protein UU77_C0019G0001 [candidate division WWE3 bacterium GW2011_GWC1_41_7]KKS21932.1 MAG: hypothetical protein UU80_C0017G0033 [candidate division WWE3 bacterium GW2011_GWA1_41_8]